MDSQVNYSIYSEGIPGGFSGSLGLPLQVLGLCIYEICGLPGSTPLHPRRSGGVPGGLGALSRAHVQV